MKNVKQQKITAQTPPQALDIEEAVLGAALVDKRAIYTLMEVVKTPDVFYKGEHQKIFAAIQQLDRQSKPVDIFTVAEQLKYNNHLSDVGGEYKIIDLSSKIASAAHIEMHSRILLQYHLKRQLLQLGNEITASAYREDTDPFDLQSNIEKKLTDISNGIQHGEPARLLSDHINELTDRLKMLENLKPGELIGLPTGFKALDRLTGGYGDGHLIIIAARPGMGKTSYMLKKASEVAKQGKAVGIFSVEMPAMELAARLATINSHFHLRQIMQTGLEKTEYWSRWWTLVSQFEKFPIIIDDNSMLTISELRRRAIAMKRKHNIQILFVDYIQLMSEELKGSNREREIANISRGLKRLAKELDVPVIALAQLSRKVEERTDKRPRLSDLRESGAIEQDADMVQMIFRPAEYQREMDDEELLNKYPNANTEIIINKNRHGSKGKIGIYFDANKVKFMDVSELQLTETAQPF